MQHSSCGRYLWPLPICNVIIKFCKINWQIYFPLCRFHTHRLIVKVMGIYGPWYKDGIVTSILIILLALMDCSEGITMLSLHNTQSIRLITHFYVSNIGKWIPNRIKKVEITWSIFFFTSFLIACIGKYIRYPS